MMTDDRRTTDRLMAWWRLVASSVTRAMHALPSLPYTLHTDGRRSVRQTGDNRRPT